MSKKALMNRPPSTRGINKNMLRGAIVSAVTTQLGDTEHVIQHYKIPRHSRFPKVTFADNPDRQYYATRIIVAGWGTWEAHKPSSTALAEQWNSNNYHWSYVDLRDSQAPVLTLVTNHQTYYVPMELANEARTIGKAWGEQEAELWRDEYPGRELPEWSRGQYAGQYPGGPYDDEQDDQRDLEDALDIIIDRAAEEEWNAA